MEHDGNPLAGRGGATWVGPGGAGLIAVLGAAALVLAPLAARHAAGSSACSAADDGAARVARLAPATVEAPRGRLALRVADTASARASGLMCVRNVPHGYGMLFAFPSAAGDARRFRMKNALVPLDVVFVADGGTVTGVAADVPPPPRGARDAELPTLVGRGRYVVELAAGDAALFGIVGGSRLAIPPGGSEP